MKGLTSLCTNLSLFCILIVTTGCNAKPDTPHTIDVKVSQQWQLKPGDKIGRYRVLGGLGDISIALDDQPIYAPLRGEVRIDQSGCLFYSSSELPMYMFRLCGLRNSHILGILGMGFERPQTGTVESGQELGRGEALQFATLRQQTNGKWAVVEPDRAFIEQLLNQPNPK
jgi:hypothetical protein